MSEHVNEISVPVVLKNKSIHMVELFLFNVRWALIPFYLGLVVVLFYYGFSYFSYLIEFFSKHGINAPIEEVELFGLNTIDIVMVANLVKMIITGSYNSFVSKLHGYVNDNISSGELKIKITTSVVVLSVIHLLSKFMNPDASWELISHQLIMFVVFLLATIVLALVERLHHK